MYKLAYLLDYDALGIVFPFLSVITIKCLILVIPSANGTMQSYLTQIWQISLIKVFGDSSSLVNKHFGFQNDQSVLDLSNLSFEEFLKRDINQSKQASSSVQKERTKELDKDWIIECCSKIYDCLVNLEQNFYKLAERNNLKVLQVVNQLVESLVCSCSKVFLRTSNYKIFIVAHYIICYCEALCDLESDKDNEKDKRKTIFPISSEFHASLTEVSNLIENESKEEPNASKKVLKLIKLEALFRYATDIKCKISSETTKSLYITLVRLLEIKNEKITLVKESTDLTNQQVSISKLSEEQHTQNNETYSIVIQEEDKCDCDELYCEKCNQLASKPKSTSKNIITDIDVFLCSQVQFLENNLDLYFGFKRIISQFSQEMCEQIYSLCVNEIQSINSDEYFSNKAYGFSKKCRLYCLIYMIMDSSNHKLHEQCITFLLSNMKECYSINFPVQKTFATVVLMCLRNCLHHFSPNNIKLKNKVFAEIFCQLSQKFECVSKAASSCIEIILKNENCKSISELLDSRYGVFWSNVFSSIKYLDINTNTEKILLIFRSLKAFGANTFKLKLDDVLGYLSSGIDHFLEINDWRSLLTIFEIVIITSELVNECRLNDPKHSNAIKNLVLRLKPFFASVRNKRLVNYSIVIYKNLIPYLNLVGFEAEESKNFSDEDGPNVICNDGLSILTYKFYEDFIFILNTKNEESKTIYDKPEFNVTSNHIHVLQLFTEINKYRDEFFVSGHRFYEDIMDPMIVKLSSFTDTNSKSECRLVQEYINLYRSISFKPFNGENPYESRISILQSHISRVEQILSNPVIK